jgi:hypothetical protein
MGKYIPTMDALVKGLIVTAVSLVVINRLLPLAPGGMKAKSLINGA